MAGITFLDIVARFPGCCGEDADAKSAFTQITLAEAADILGVDHVPETYISLPRSRWPADWVKREAGGELEDPVCPLRINVYGHSLAGLLWDKCSQRKILECGFENVLGWESLYVHEGLQVFLGVYVDDCHFSGVKASLTKAWELL